VRRGFGVPATCRDVDLTDERDAPLARPVHRLIRTPGSSRRPPAPLVSRRTHNREPRWLSPHAAASGRAFRVLGRPHQHIARARGA